MRRYRKFLISHIIFLLMSFMGSRSDLTLIRLTRIAEYFCKKDYYKKIIQRIRTLFYEDEALTAEIDKYALSYAKIADKTWDEYKKKSSRSGEKEV